MEREKPGLRVNALTVQKGPLARPSVVVRAAVQARRVPGFDPVAYEELRRMAAEGRLKPLTRDNIEEAIAFVRGPAKAPE